MRKLFHIVVVSVAVSLSAWAQVGLQGQPAKDPELSRALDRAYVAFTNAQREAAAGKKQAFTDALNVANVRWAEVYGKYREWPTSDTAWRPNFDAINAALLNAVNALTPGDNLPAAKAQMDAATSTLNSLRSRNGIIDIRAAGDTLHNSLNTLETTIAGLQGRPLTAADVEALRGSFGSFRDAWLVYSQALVDFNAFGLGDGRLEQMRQYILLQNIGIDSIYNILSNPQTGSLVTEWQGLRDRVLAMLQELQQETIAADAAAAAAATPATPAEQDKSGPGGIGDRDRPRLFPRLRR